MPPVFLKSVTVNRSHVKKRPAAEPVDIRKLCEARPLWIPIGEGRGKIEGRLRLGDVAFPLVLSWAMQGGRARLAGQIAHASCSSLKLATALWRVQAGTAFCRWAIDPEDGWLVLEASVCTDQTARPSAGLQERMVRDFCRALQDDRLHAALEEAGAHSCAEPCHSW